MRAYKGFWEKSANCTNIKCDSNVGKGSKRGEVGGEVERENAFLTGIVVCTGTQCAIGFFSTQEVVLFVAVVFIRWSVLCMVCSYFATVPNPIKKLEKSTEK